MNFNRLYKTLLEKTTLVRHGFRDDDTVIDQLLPYVNDPDVYIHFSDLNKLGNNPRSKEKFKTPQGIYLYPLKQYWDKYLAKMKIKNTPFDINDYQLNKNDRDYLYKRFFTSVIPYRSEAKYIIVARVDGDANVVDFHSKELSDISNRDYDDYREILENYANGQNINIDVVRTIFAHAESYAAFPKNKLNRLWYVTLCLSMKDITDSSDVDHVARVISRKDLTEFGYSTNIIKWGYLLNKILKLDMITDKKGLGAIHPSEPIQAVAFQASSLTHINTILNKEQYSLKRDEAVRRKLKFNKKMTTIGADVLSGRVEFLKLPFKTQTNLLKNTLSYINGVDIPQRLQTHIINGGGLISNSWKNIHNLSIESMELVVKRDPYNIFGLLIDHKNPSDELVMSAYDRLKKNNKIDGMHGVLWCDDNFIKSFELLGRIPPEEMQLSMVEHNPDVIGKLSSSLGLNNTSEAAQIKAVMLKPKSINSLSDTPSLKMQKVMAWVDPRLILKSVFVNMDNGVVEAADDLRDFQLLTPSRDTNPYSPDAYKMTADQYDSLKDKTKKIMDEIKGMMLK